MAIFSTITQPDQKYILCNTVGVSCSFCRLLPRTVWLLRPHRCSTKRWVTVNKLIFHSQSTAVVMLPVIHSGKTSQRLILTSLLLLSKLQMIVLHIVSPTGDLVSYLLKWTITVLSVQSPSYITHSQPTFTVLPLRLLPLTRVSLFSLESSCEQRWPTFGDIVTWFDKASGMWNCAPVPPPCLWILSQRFNLFFCQDVSHFNGITAQIRKRITAKKLPN